ncbi:type II toxin-antitoxin system RelE/ParE family toxin [Nitrospira sp. M1]
MAYKLTPEAENDLDIIYDYSFFTFGEIQADKYAQELLHCFSILTQTPLICRERSEFNPPVRIYQHKSHLIIYTIKSSDILIIRILHKNMDPPRHLPSAE